VLHLALAPGRADDITTVSIAAPGDDKKTSADSTLLYNGGQSGDML